MKRLLATALGLLVAASVVHAAGPDPFATGDRKMDDILFKLNREAKPDPDGFMARIATRFSLPQDDLRQARDTHALDPGGLYMAAALARATQRPLLSVCEDYKKNEGKGWGVLAQQMGIKPGSPAFHELKRSGQACLNDIRADARSKQKHEKQAKKERERARKAGDGERGGGRPH